MLLKAPPLPSINRPRPIIAIPYETFQLLSKQGSAFRAAHSATMMLRHAGGYKEQAQAGRSAACAMPVRSRAGAFELSSLPGTTGSIADSGRLLLAWSSRARSSSDHWNLCMAMPRGQYGLNDPDELRNPSSPVLELDSCAIDSFAAAATSPFFLDINVYRPSLAQHLSQTRDSGVAYFDACARLGIDEPLGGMLGPFRRSIRNLLMQSDGAPTLAAATAGAPPPGTEAGRKQPPACRRHRNVADTRGAAVGRRLEDGVGCSQSLRPNSNRARRQGP